MKKICFILSASVLLAGCNYRSTENDDRAGAQSGYTMNEPAGGSTKTNAPSGTSVNGQQPASRSPASGESGSKSPGPAGNP